MTKNLPAIPDQDKRVASALRLHAAASASAAQMAIAAAKCGLELKAIKKDVGHGAFEAFFASEFATHGLSLRTAQKYMALADGLKGKALKNESGAFLKLLDAAPSTLSDKDQATLTKAVGKVTDGKALSELYQDFGIVKKPQGSGAKGGKPKAATTTPEGTSEADADAEPETDANTSKIPAGWEERAYHLNQLLEEALTDGWWNDCTEAHRRTLHGNLVDAQARVAETLKEKSA